VIPILAALVLATVVVSTTSCTTALRRPLTEQEAVRMAIASIERKYGPECVAKESPFTGELTNGIWIVRGTLPPGTIGGTAVAEVSAGNGKVLRMWHEQ
jgi:hypothetical protein